ncbi:hypothetical protein [Mucilaginibacter panaciglaebae]|uniref:TonB-like protein n=1 Tax=Mucilaginibacter panaciglaebae TaxID=502331 RepID=A0ABP7X4Z6_9SPHI
MKKIILITAFFLTSIGLANAQRLKVNSTVQAKRGKYKIDMLADGKMIVSNTNSVYGHHVPKVKNTDFQIETATPQGLYKAFKEVFKDERLKELTTEPNIAIEIFVSTKGKVEYINFIVKTNTLITAEELEGLEDAIKRNVSYKIKSDQSTDFEAFPLVKNVLFSNVLKGPRI